MAFWAEASEALESPVWICRSASRSYMSALLGALVICSCTRLMALAGCFWNMIGRSQDAKSAGGVGIEGEGLLEQGLALGNVLLKQTELGKLEIGARVFGIVFDGCAEVRVSLVVVLLAAFCHAAPDVRYWRLGGDGHGRFSGLCEAGEVSKFDGGLREAFLGFHALRIESGGVAEGLSAAAGKSPLARAARPSQILSCRLSGLAFDAFWRSLEGFFGLAVVQQNQAVEKCDVGREAVGLLEVGDDGPGLGEVFLQDQDACIRDLEGSALRMLRDEVGVDGLCVIKLFGADKVVRKHIGAGSGVVDIIRCLAEVSSVFAASP